MSLETPSTADPDSERKFVTILRADVVHSTDLIAELEPEQAVSRLEPALEAMRAAVRQFGGIVSKELGDGLSAVFGAPIADDNHAPLACHAAIELVRRVQALRDPGLQVRVGLHSGLVVTYVVASEFSKVYEIGGAAQHLAARLESIAEPGQIYASDACQKLSEGHVRFESLGPKTLRGFAEPISIYRVVGASDLSSWRVRKARSVSRFVGRSDETALLRGVADSVGRGGQTICLSGDPGIGKSRLIHEFVQELEGEGWKLIEAECSPNLQGSPFAALKVVLLSILGPRTGSEGSGQAEDPRSGLPQIMRTAIDAVLDLPISDAHWDRLEPQSRGRVISDATCALVEKAASHRRTVLLIEDLHWLDRASDSVVAALTSLRAANLLIVVTSRPSGLPDWISQRGVKNLSLRPLDESSGLAMLDSIVGLSATTLDLKGRIIRHTASVPLFIEEVCRRLKEINILQGQWGALILAKSIEELGIPNSIQGVIAARLDRLSREERIVMQAAAALGPRSTLATLREVAELSETVLQDSLEGLDRAELLVRAADLSAESCEFPHDMVRQVTYDSMVQRTRERIHTRILAVLEGDEGLRDEPDKLCYHATRARNWPKAFAYGRTVARKCVGRSAFADAASHYEISMDALDRTPVSRERETEAIDLRIEARMAFMGTGRVSEWLDLGRQAVKRADSIDDIGRKVAAMTIRAAAQNFYGTPIEAIAAGEQVVHLAEEWGNPGWLNHAEYGLGQAYYLGGRYRDSETMLARACTQLMGPAPRAPIGTTTRYMLLMCCMMKAIAHTTLGEFEIAGEFQRRADEIADESGRPFDRAAAAYSGGGLILARGDPAAAAILLDDAFALAREHDMRIFIPVIGCQRGMAYLDQGRIDAASAILTEAREAARAVGYTSSVVRTSTHLAAALAQAGHSPDALQMVRDARNTARQQGFRGLEAEALYYEAVITPATHEDERSAVVRSLQACIAIATECEAKPLRARAEALLDRMLAATRI
ncbi:AAA family ATPase [Bradyrhizobium genosp. L]|uniref:ATP-binding protein n=1 Tax=Bradyrhizobium genosp. L TaxID=83637 RepID=UPI0018A32784|nr:adenylate/guanylate cyclase domain-containing protein [Bradyrhizobium genosp. L]QPF83187.1 AAA family ATPase [Bradyrhizobium genosp. L]